MLFNSYLFARSSGPALFADAADFCVVLLFVIVREKLVDVQVLALVVALCVFAIVNLGNAQPFRNIQLRVGVLVQELCRWLLRVVRGQHLGAALIRKLDVDGAR